MGHHHHHHHQSNCQIPLPACTQIWHLCVLDPYNSTHTIIRVTVKFRYQLAPRFGTSVCMTHIPALTHTYTHTHTHTHTHTVRRRERRTHTHTHTVGRRERHT